MPPHKKTRVPLGLGELARRSPEAVALAAPHCRSLTFRGLVEQIESAGEALGNAGAYPGTAIALAVTQGPAAVTAALAIMSGSACAPVEWNLTEKEYEDYFGQLRPSALVWDGASNPVAAQAARQLGIGVIELRVPGDGPAGAFEIAEVSAAARDLNIRQTDQAMIFQTSATTGMPKLVPRSHAALEILASENAANLELSAADRYLNLISLTHAAGPDAIFGQLASGGSVFCTPGFREDGFVEWLDVFRPTWFLATPTVHRAILLAVQQVKLEFLAQIPLRFVRTGGAPADSELMHSLEQRFGVPVLEGYGLAEVPTVSRNRLSWRKPGSVGRSTGPEISIQDESGKVLPADVEGEVVVRGPTVMDGYLDDYLDNPEANRQAFRAGWFRTGDIGRMDADGFLFLVGRRKEFINRGARKILPREVDDALIHHPAVVDAATFAIPHRSLGEDVAACVILREGERVSERELREFTSHLLAPFRVPRRIFFVPSIPKTASGKPKRLELTGRFGEALAASRRVVDAGPGTSRPLTETEAMLLAIWAAVLGIETPRLEDDFFDLGGDSLSAASMLRRVFDSFGPGHDEFVQAEFLNRPTVSSLAQILGSRAEATVHPELSNPAVVFRSEGGRTPFFLFCNTLTEAYQLRHLSRSLDPDQPFSAFCPPEPVRGNRLLTVEHLAQESRASIRAVRPSGPYILGAYCGAAPLAYETALQLMAEGEQVPVLMLFDAPAPGYPKVRNHVSAYLTHAAKILRGAARTSWSELLEHVRMVGRLARRRLRGKVLRAKVSTGASDLGKNIPACLTVCEEYVLRPFPARIVHFLAADLEVSTRVLTDPRCGWADFAEGGLEEHYLAGDHASLFAENHASAVAAGIQKTIDAVGSRASVERR